MISKIMPMYATMAIKDSTIVTMEMTMPAVAIPFPSPPSSPAFLLPIMLKINPISGATTAQIKPAKAIVLLLRSTGG